MDGRRAGVAACPCVVRAGIRRLGEWNDITIQKIAV
jgi:hypothetical protein